MAPPPIDLSMDLFDDVEEVTWRTLLRDAAAAQDDAEAVELVIQALERQFVDVPKGELVDRTMLKRVLAAAKAAGWRAMEVAF